MRALIVTADDFGLDPAINEAVELAHRDGVLSAASLMVAGAACADAVERARRMQGLRVGLHVVVVDGRPLLPPDQVPALVGDDGCFRRDLVASGLRYFASPAARRQLRAEIAAQFEAFRATGLPLDHVNAHNHMHVHPTVFAIIVQVAQRFGCPPVRIPYEPPLVSWRAARRDLPLRLGATLGLLPWLALMRLRLRFARLRANDRVFGLFDSGGMDEQLLLRLIDRLPEGVSEIYLHPTAYCSAAVDREMPGYRGEAEFHALLSPQVREILASRSVRLGGFTDLLAAA